MRRSATLIIGLTFAAAAGLAAVTAQQGAILLERSTETAVRAALDEAGYDWAEIHGDGLQLILEGTAPSEADRFAAIGQVGGVIDAARVIDRMDVTPTAALGPPRFSVEILRNDAGISMIGLVPADTDRSTIAADLRGMVGPDRVTDLLETADHPPPDGWTDAIGYAIAALDQLPRAKVSVEAGRVVVTAITDSAAERDALETALLEGAPPSLALVLDIAAPRPVITPFTMRFLIDEAGPHFDACSAATDLDAARILAVAREIGAEATECTVGMGAPSPHWATAVELGLRALADLGAGSVTLANADMSLVAAPGTDPGRFERIAGELDSALPAVFALKSVPPIPGPDGTAGATEFIATLSPEGQVQLRGRVSDAGLRQMADSFAKAQFGVANVYTAARIVPDLPDDWTMRVLAGLEGLGQLSFGALVVTPDQIALRGTAPREDARAEIARLMAQRLPAGTRYTLDIAYQPPRVPTIERDAPDPLSCAAEIAEVQRAGKITFEPGSARIAADSLGTIAAIADILQICGDIPLEIHGHTDSQGREEMNQRLSQERADAILSELRGRRVPTGAYTAIGYGETRPIADNATSEGREANRRIEFHVVNLDGAIIGPTAELDAPLDPDADAETGATPAAATEEAQE